MKKIILCVGPLHLLGAGIAAHYAAVDKAIEDGSATVIEFQGEVLSVDWSVASDESWGTEPRYNEELRHKMREDLKEFYPAYFEKRYPERQHYRGYMNSRQRYKK